ncbi:unnamed protein product [Phaedon cochleariae]|uniref:EF-hand domain-containing protein n=1 Tax=Phaedon cochleariae TaxID=80249 RepID=A0A9P0DUB9_PHACE|nr:unnamed protein product [Phaedon cochleariae]
MEATEFARVSQKNPHILNDEELKDYYGSIFLCCDSNRDGIISINELKTFIEIHEEFELPDEVMRTIYEKYDKNMDEKLDLEEFVEMINSPTFSVTFQKFSNRILKFVVVPTINRKTTKLCRTITKTGSYDAEMKWRKSAVGLIIISLLQIILYYVNNFLKRENDHDVGDIYEKLSFNPCLRYQIYRYFTYMFVHSGESHLFANVILQLVLGISLELVHTWRIPCLYFAGVIGGALFHSVIDRTPLVGGSAGAYSFYTAHVAVVILNWREMSHPAVRLILFTIIIVIDAICAQMTSSNNVSYWSHFGGAVIGLLFGVNILRNLRVTQLETYIWYISLTVLGITIFTLIILDCVLQLPMTIYCS